MNMYILNIQRKNWNDKYHNEIKNKGEKKKKKKKKNKKKQKMRRD